MMESPTFRSRWRENHGNLLVGISLLIILVGSFLKVARDKANESSAVPGAAIRHPESAPDELAAGTSLLEIRVSGMGNDEGKVRIALYTDPKSFNVPELADQKASLDITDGIAEWIVQVPADEPVAINAYHDQNDNGELDLNLLGIPSEKYGYSRGARSPGGPPPFDESAFIPQAGVVQVPLEIW